MRWKLLTTCLFLPVLATGAAAQAQPPAAPAARAAVEKPAALTADGIPAVPAAIAEASRPYMEFRTAGFTSWNPRDRSMTITTRFGNTNQIHTVARPMADRQQLSFEAEPVSGQWSPTGDVLLAQKDIGGNEFFQIYTLTNGRLNLLTDGRSRNQFNAWSRDGRWIAYTSTRRNGADSDIYVMDPRNRGSDRLVAQVKGGGWGVNDFHPDGRRAIVGEYISITKSNLHLLDLQSGRMTPVGDHARDVAYGGAQFAPNGTLWVTSDQGSEFQRLGTLDPATGVFRPVVTNINWDVENFDIADDGSFIAFSANEAGRSRVYILDPRTGRTRPVTTLPAGLVGGLEIAPWGDIGITFTSARSAADAYSIDPRTLAVTRWTKSETGGLDPNVNVEPELIEVRSFDGEPVSGFLYRPDPRRFPGPRPLIVNIHGGPEAQSRPGFLGRNNYLLNEQGIAIFYPNVRGSTGFGKRFVGLDNGAALRENSVQDIGAFLDRFERDPGIDRSRIGVTGGSYGGYMCYASAIRYGQRLRGANCAVAISNFVTFLENTQSYRRDLRRVEYGDERDPAERARLLAISPMTRSRELNIPLMVVTGRNDPRVPASEADQMVAAVRANGKTAWHLIGENEGHGFAKKENADYLFWTSLMFWQQNLLGDGVRSAPAVTGAPAGERGR
ncbi:MAG TPA: prolyl oligopeptidase family serine peptidase [Allosphingosinicella sp.]|nr:prolyl oligopeptidase family serine peptidase [Allosphingosinicella sp.]